MTKSSVLTLSLNNMKQLLCAKYGDRQRYHVKTITFPAKARTPGFSVAGVALLQSMYLHRTFGKARNFS